MGHIVLEGGSELVAKVVLVHVGYVGKRSCILFQHLNDHSLQRHHVSRVMPEHLGNKGILAHELVLIEVALPLEFINEIESVGGHHGADQSARTGILHLLFIILEDGSNFLADCV